MQHRLISIRKWRAVPYCEHGGHLGIHLDTILQTITQIIPIHLRDRYCHDPSWPNAAIHCNDSRVDQFLPLGRVPQARNSPAGHRWHIRLVQTPVICRILLLGLGHTARASEPYLFCRLYNCYLEVFLFQDSSGRTSSGKILWG